jgi:tRNA threonylcarbamoyladenosine biosynthesis protein TsaE
MLFAASDKIRAGPFVPFTIDGKYLCNMEWIFALDEIDDVAGQLVRTFGGKMVWALEGGMGAGKTTLVHALCQKLGVSGNVSSPTFPVINQYRTADGQTVYHIDLYRLKDEEEAVNAGVEDCLYSGSRCLVEWPGRAPGLFGDDALLLRLEVMGDGRRRLIG